jgi:D-serine deaminase-like pyridoxal phosphate-dependent protein
MAFAGHSYAAITTHQRLAVLECERHALAITAAALRALGLDPGVLSVGSTPLAGIARAGVDEYRFGNYPFYDATQVALGTAEADDCAVWVEATVLDQPAPDRIILDAGSKTLAAERVSGATTGFGLVRNRPDIEVAQLYEEHAICRLTGDAPAPAIGDVLEVVPNHACTCANLHAAYAVRHADGSESRWPLDARGWDADAYHNESEAHG